MIIANTNQCKVKKLNKMELEAQKKKGLLKKSLKITTGIRSHKYEVGQTMQWPRENRSKRQTMI
jgi:hypothetical protein